MSRDTRWQEWFENENYNTPPPQIEPRKTDFVFGNYSVIQPLFIPVLPGPVTVGPIRVSSCYHHHDHCGSRYRKIKARPYRTPRVWPYPYPPVFPFFGRPDVGRAYQDTELTEFMPCGQPSILLGQIIPEEISTLILDLENEKISEQHPTTSILVDDSFLKNDLDEMNDIIPLIKTEPNDEIEDLNDSGIEKDPLPPTQVPEKKHQCQFCKKPYQSISGLKYHLKKASNECSIKFKAKPIQNSI